MTIFGSLMTAVYVAHTSSNGIGAMAGSSLDEALAFAMKHDGLQTMLIGAMQAFESSFTAVTSIVIAMLLILSVVVLTVHSKVLKKHSSALAGPGSFNTCHNSHPDSVGLQSRPSGTERSCKEAYGNILAGWLSYKLLIHSESGFL